MLCSYSPFSPFILQPYDRGTVSGKKDHLNVNAAKPYLQINGVEVLRVLRRGAVAVHFTEEPLEEGAEVEVEVDWNRRFDHMQQHSGNTNILVVCINPVSATLYQDTIQNRRKRAYY